MKNWCKKGLRALLLKSAVVMGLGLFQPQAVMAAEEIVFSVFSIFELSVSIDSLERFADGGPAEGNLGLIVRRMGEEDAERLRTTLRRRLDIDVVTVSRASNAPLVESVYKRLGRVIQGNLGRVNHWRGIRGAVVTAANHPDGLTLLNVMRQFPLRTIRVRVSSITEIVNELSALAAYRDATVDAIAQQSETEIAAGGVEIGGLPDPSRTGPYEVEQQVLPLRIRAIRQTRLGLAKSFTFNTNLYLPKNLDRPAPLVVISHGFGDRPETFSPFGEHLASHGYIVAIPEHIGSDAAYREGLLRGNVPNTTSPIEYVNRPLDITHLLNELESLAETDPAWRDRIDFDQIGVMGHSFGGYTAFALAGAPLNQERLATCTTDEITLNISLLLQCRAKHLPPISRNLTDDRVKAVISVNPITSKVSGPESLSQIAIPTMMVTGTNDWVAPAVHEQIHPFVWLETPDKYLAAMVPGTHNSITENPDNPERGGLALLSGPRPDLGRRYLQGLSLAFFETHVRQNSDYQPHLSAAYAREVGDPELDLYLVRSLEPEQLKAAFGRTPPVPVIPAPLSANQLPPPDETVLAEIEREGLLKIAMREDAPPFGYLDTDGVWTGYCLEFADRFAAFLADRLNRAGGVEVVRLPSNLEDRFDLVRQGTVHLECGPNTIRDNREEGIAFSGAFFAAGTQFLVSAEREAELNAPDGFVGEKIGVLDESTAAQFLAETHPRARAVLFSGPTGRAEGVQAIVRNDIGAFASDSVLLVGEVVRQGLQPSSFALIPERPLTCAFYGMLLPANDPEWGRAVNDFLDADNLNLSKQWAEGLSFNFVDELDRCFNRTP